MSAYVSIEYIPERKGQNNGNLQPLPPLRDDYSNITKAN